MTISLPDTATPQGLYVVETDDDWYLGTIEIREDEALVIRSGFRGRPAVVFPDELVDLTLADEHPDVEEGTERFLPELPEEPVVPGHTFFASTTTYNGTRARCSCGWRADSLSDGRAIAAVEWEQHIKETENKA